MMIPVSALLFFLAHSHAASGAFSLRKSSSVSSSLVSSPVFNNKSSAKRSTTSSSRGLETIQLTGRESIVFKSCETLSVETSYSSTVKGVKSFVEFDVVCQPAENCYNSIDGARTTYVTSLADYVLAFSEFLPTKQQEYCQGCMDNYQYCLVSASQGQSAQQNRGGGRRLAGDIVYEAIDCQRCFSYGCMNTRNEYHNRNQEWTQKQSLEWIQSMASCHRDRDNPITIEGQQVSFGFMCNQEGTGVEIAAFLDDQCTLYTNQVAYSRVMSNSESFLWWKSKPNIEYIFNNDFSCYDTKVKYVRPDFLNSYMDSTSTSSTTNNNGGGDAYDYQLEAGEWCWNVFSGDMMPVAMSDCGGESYYNNGNGEAGTSSYQQQVQDTTDYYTLSLEEAQYNGSAVCFKLNANGGSGEHLYSNVGSGKMYRYSSSTGSTTRASSYAAVSSTNNKQENPNWFSALDEMTKQYQQKSAGWTDDGWVHGLISSVVIIVVAVAVGTVVAKKRERWATHNTNGSASLSSSTTEKEQPILSAGDDNNDVPPRPHYRRFGLKFSLR